MSDEGIVRINGIVISVYNSAYDLIDNIYNALIKKWCWKDHHYLARIIYDEIVGDRFKTETGFGLFGDNESDDFYENKFWRVVNVYKETVSINDTLGNHIEKTRSKIKIIDRNEIKFDDTFKKFIKIYERDFFGGD